MLRCQFHCKELTEHQVTAEGYTLKRVVPLLSDRHRSKTVLLLTFSFGHIDVWIICSIRKEEIIVIEWTVVFRIYLFIVFREGLVIRKLT